MTRQGKRIEHPGTGETMVFLQTDKETKGKLLQIDMFVEPGGFVAAEHIHPHQEERFIIRSGKIGMRLAGVEHTYRAGEEATVPPGTPHVWWNGGAEELHVVLEFRPAGRFEDFITSFFALSQAGRTYAAGMPSPLQMVVMLHAYRDTIRTTWPSQRVQRILLPVLAGLGRLLGYSADHPYPLRQHPAFAEARPAGADRRPLIHAREQNGRGDAVRA